LDPFAAAAEASRIPEVLARLAALDPNDPDSTRILEVCHGASAT
jgi:hypothetical protein